MFQTFIIEIHNDQDEHDIKVTNVKRKRLEAFFNNEVVHDYLMGEKGPIERIYSKIAERTLVDRDTIAEFKKEDFMVTAELADRIHSAGADPKAEKMVREFMADESGLDEAQKIADYLNQFVNEVIQRCAGIEPGDFKQMFLDIRKELCRLEKKLTLFIEDVTSFTGVDTALLDALIEAHTGKTEGEKLCRISSIVGTTNNYLEKNFSANHKDRITKYIYIPDDVLDESGLYEFIARYVNTMSLTEDVISEWLAGHAKPEDYPIHDVVEGKNWEFVNISYGKKINIYPFTKKSILHLYKNVLEKGHQTPRYIIRDIIEPVVRDAVFNKDIFPSIDVKLVNVNNTLSFRIHSQIKEQSLADRLLKFMSVWGDGTTNQYQIDGKDYLSGIPKEIFDDFNFPVLKMDVVQVPDSTTVNSVTTIESETKEKDNDQVIPAIKIKKVDDANTLLTKWTNEHVIDISATVGAAGTVHSAIYTDIPEYLYTAINWQVEGISMDNAKKVKAVAHSSMLFVALEGQTKNEGFYTLPATWENTNIILAFIRWKEYGNRSWNYPDADFDAYLITTWTESIKKEIVKKVAEYKTGEETRYIEAAVTAEMYRIILKGEFRENSLKNFNTQVLLASKPNKVSSNSHCKEWNSLLSAMSQKGADLNNQQTVRRYFNIGQGGGEKNIVLDVLLLSRVFGKVKRNKLVIQDDEKQYDDKIRQRRDAYSFLNLIEERMDTVAKAELSMGREYIQRIYDAFGDDEVGEAELAEFKSRVKKFYDQANNAQINVKEVSLNGIKKLPQIEKAISDIAGVLDENNPLTIIMAFSGDPISILKPLIDVIESLENEVAKANNLVATKQAALGMIGTEDSKENRYSEELKSIQASKLKLEGMVNT